MRERQVVFSSLFALFSTDTQCNSVRIDIDQLLREREADRESSTISTEFKSASWKKEEEPQDDIVSLKTASRKRKLEAGAAAANAKKVKVKGEPASHNEPTSKSQPKLSITLKLGPRADQEEILPCCLCVATNPEGLLHVINPPFARKDVVEAAGHPTVWMAHEFCARVVPETWVDTSVHPDGSSEKVVYGVDGIVKDRWNLVCPPPRLFSLIHTYDFSLQKCSACTKGKLKAHGAPIQCSKGKCAKAFHVNCARDGQIMGIVFGVVREVDKEVILLDDTPPIEQSIPIAVTEGQRHMTENAMLHKHNSSPGCVVKVVKKFEIQTLCTQHNPVSLCHSETINPPPRGNLPLILTM